MKKDINYYKELFANLHFNKSFGPAPHKPLLLYTVMLMYSQGEYWDDKVWLTPSLEKNFKSLWSYLVTSTNHVCTITKPFYHMNYEPFWKISVKDGYEELFKDYYKMYNIKNLKDSIQWASLDVELVALLINSESAHELASFLLDTYFHDTNNKLPQQYTV